MTEEIQLELAWEAIQEFYVTYANINAYKEGLPSFCSFGEKTYLINMSKRKIQAYYDKNDMVAASERGLHDFLNAQWIEIFKKKALQAIRDAIKFTEKYYLNNVDLTKEELFIRIKVGTKINDELFYAFQACQPQYTSKVEAHISNLLPKYLKDEEKNEIIRDLSLSIKETPILVEEIAWSKIIQKYNDKYNREIPNIEDYNFSELEEHSKKYGLIRAADGLKPWSKGDLYKRLKDDINNEDILGTEENWKKQKTEIEKRKQEIIKTYKISQEVIRHCENIADLGNIRISLRINGWMPIIYILMQELFPQLDKHLPYTLQQLESCKPVELFKIFDGDYSLSKEELDERFNLVFYGLLDDKEVLWYGKEAEKMMENLIPSLDKNIKELHGQGATKGKVRGKCFVIHWDSKDLLKDIDEMPEGTILVAGQTRPQLMPAIKKSLAIVTDEGGLLSHAAIISRELGKPCVIGTKFATKVLNNGDLVEVDANKGIVRVLGRNQSIK